MGLILSPTLGQFMADFGSILVPISGGFGGQFWVDFGTDFEADFGLILGPTLG
jgi:hypothetical protein